MKQKLTDANNYPKSCKNCAYARIPKDPADAILCEKQGVVQADYSCKKYKYDPLKRVPNKIVIDTGYTEEDFKL